jgi:glycosyltransferase involved in cell wall biosynthesis
MLNGISIVVCTYNGKDKLSKTLNSIKQLQVNCNWELIVIDNASNDGTGEFVKEFLRDFELDWQLIVEKKPGLIYAKLCGLKVAKYDVLLYCDDDNILDKNYLQIGFELLQKNATIGALGGSGIPVFEKEKPNWFDTYSYSFAVGPQSSKDGILKEYPAELYGAGTFFRKELLLNYIEKGFQSVLTGRTGTNLVSGEDVELCYLIQLSGYKIGYDHRLIFEHIMPENRMKWDYYIRLKQGISLSVCRLLPYHCLFKNPRASSLFFLGHWLKQTIFSTLVNLRQKSVGLFLRKSKTSKELLIAAIWEAKAKAYWRDGYIAYKHFKQLKKHIQ